MAGVLNDDVLASLVASAWLVVVAVATFATRRWANAAPGGAVNLLLLPHAIVPGGTSNNTSTSASCKYVSAVVVLLPRRLGVQAHWHMQQQRAAGPARRRRRRVLRQPSRPLALLVVVRYAVCRSAALRAGLQWHNLKPLAVSLSLTSTTTASGRLSVYY